MLKSRTLLFAFLVFSFALLMGCEEEGEGPLAFSEPETIEDRCEHVCDQLYNRCDLAMQHSNGALITERACVSRCIANEEFRGYENCIADAICRETIDEMVLGCFPAGMQASHCEHLGLWPVELERMENQVLDLVNEVRATGTNCGTNGNFGPAEPVRMDEDLRCAARLHSIDMVERNYFEHDTPEGITPFDRIDEAGYRKQGPQGENIAAGYRTPESVMEGWLSSDGHCANIMQPGFRDLGVGLHQFYWTQKFGGGR